MTVHRSFMGIDISVLKTKGFWVSLVVSVLGVVLSQHLVLEGSTLAAVIGWLLTFGGSMATGHQVAVFRKLVTG